MARRETRKLLVASLGVATVNYVATACSEPEVIGNPAFPPSVTQATIGGPTTVTTSLGTASTTGGSTVTSSTGTVGQGGTLGQGGSAGESNGGGAGQAGEGGAGGAPAGAGGEVGR